MAGLRRRRSSSRLSPESRPDRSQAFPHLLRPAICKSMRGRTHRYPRSRCRRRARLVDYAGFGSAPHSLDRQDAPRRYGFYDRDELYAQREAAREAARQAELKALEKVCPRARSLHHEQRRHANGPRTGALDVLLHGHACVLPRPFDARGFARGRVYAYAEGRNIHRPLRCTERLLGLGERGGRRFRPRSRFSYGFCPSSRATTARRSLRGERRRLSSAVGIGVGVLPSAVQHRRQGGARNRPPAASQR